MVDAYRPGAGVDPRRRAIMSVLEELRRGVKPDQLADAGYGYKLMVPGEGVGNQLANLIGAWTKGKLEAQEEVAAAEEQWSKQKALGALAQMLQNKGYSARKKTDLRFRGPEREEDVADYVAHTGPTVDRERALGAERTAIDVDRARQMIGPAMDLERAESDLRVNEFGRMTPAVIERANMQGDLSLRLTEDQERLQRSLESEYAPQRRALRLADAVAAAETAATVQPIIDQTANASRDATRLSRTMDTGVLDDMAQAIADKWAAVREGRAETRATAMRMRKARQQEQEKIEAKAEKARGEEAARAAAAENRATKLEDFREEEAIRQGYSSAAEREEAGKKDRAVKARARYELGMVMRLIRERKIKQVGGRRIADWIKDAKGDPRAMQDVYEMAARERMSGPVEVSFPEDLQALVAAGAVVEGDTIVLVDPRSGRKRQVPFLTATPPVLVDPKRDPLELDIK